MKKLTSLLLLTLVSIIGFSQTIDLPKTFFGVAEKVRTKYVENGQWTNWTDWQSTEGTLLVYIDYGFGFIFVGNLSSDRFLLTEKLSESILDTGAEEVKILSRDKEGTTTGLLLTFLKDKSIVISIIYNNLMYEYKIPKLESGYPYQYFDTPGKEKEIKIGKSELLNI